MSETVTDPAARTSTQECSTHTFHVGQRVFGRHGATGEYFAGYVVSVDPGQPFPYVVDLGGREPVHLLDHEIQSDLPAPGATHEDILEWLVDDIED